MSRYFSFLLSMIFLRVYLFSSAAHAMLTTLPTGPLPPHSMLLWPHKELIRLERWCELLCLPLNPRKCDAFSLDFHLADLQPYLILFISPPLQFYSLFSRGHFRSLFFLNTYLRFRPSFCLVLRPYSMSLLPHGVPLRSPYLLYKAFLRFFLTYASFGWFP